jgi:hypothetical protein
MAIKVAGEMSLDAGAFAFGFAELGVANALIFLLFQANRFDRFD